MACINGFSDYEIHRDGTIINTITGISLKKTKGNGGKLLVMLNKDGKQYKKYVHRLLAEAFINNQENKRYVVFKDGNASNCSLMNLKWSTRSEYQQEIADTEGTHSNKVSKEVTFISPSGIEVPIKSIKRFCELYDLNASAIRHVANKKKGYKSHKGWTLKDEEEV